MINLKIVIKCFAFVFLFDFLNIFLMCNHGKQKNKLSSLFKKKFKMNENTLFTVPTSRYL